MTTIPVAPTSRGDRFHSLDLIRGIAVAGILIMNIYAFANIFAYYLNPYALSEPSALDLATWAFTHILADQKFYTLFSMLFGAGIMLMAERARDKQVSAAKIHYKRIFWLLVFGVIHAIFIWYGDILVTYAIAGLWVYLFALRTEPRTKVIVGSILIAIILIVMALFALSAEQLPDKDKVDMIDMLTPSPELIQQETQPYTSSYSAQLEHRLDFFLTNLPMSAFFFGFFRIGGSMLLGMALYQYGVLTAQRSRSFYLKLAATGLIIGLSLTLYDTYALLKNEFDFSTAMLSFMALNSLASLFMALGYIGVFCLWVKSNLWQGFRSRLEAVGQMAFSNYISQSLICTTLFYSHGFGLFAQLSRFELLVIVAIIFMFQLLWSPWWLKRFKFGPLEWLWRSLSYGQLQPFKRVQ